MPRAVDRPGEAPPGGLRCPDVRENPPRRLPHPIDARASPAV